MAQRRVGQEALFATVSPRTHFDAIADLIG